MGGSKLSSFSQDMGLPTLSYHIPVCIVAVHGDYHSSTAGSDLCIKGAVSAEGSKELGKWIEVIQGRHLSYVSSVKKCMYSDLLYTFLLCLFHHSLQVIDVGVDVSIGKKTDEVKGGTVVLCILDKLLPGLSFIHLSRFDGRCYKLCSLAENSSAAHGVVSNLAVSHIGICRKTYSCSVSLQLCPGAGFIELVQILCDSRCNCIPFLVLSKTDTIHDDQDNRAISLDFVILLQCFNHFHFSKYLDNQFLLKGEVASSSHGFVSSKT